MDNFGLTEVEKKTNLHGYNHALFKNMMSFLDVAWEINVLTGTVFVFEDKGNPDMNDTEYTYVDILEEYRLKRVKEEDRAVLCQYLAMENLLKLTKEVYFDVEMRSKEGEWQLYHAVLTPAFDEQNLLYCVYLGARNVQKEEDFSPAKAEYWSKMGHDIRTPMNAIIGMTTIAQNHMDDPSRVADCLNKISISAKHLLGLLNEVLDAGSLEINKVVEQENAQFVGREAEAGGEPPLETEDFDGHRVLLVEDDELNAEIEEEILKMTGLEIDHVWDGQEAVKRMAEVPDGYYDIVFMDIQMPVMNGNDATRAIRAMDREYAKKVPILAMSANAFAEDILASIASGMNEHIAKPIDFAQLKRALDKWISV